MNKSELIDKIHKEDAGTATKKQVKQAVDAFLESVLESLAEGDDVPLGNIGKLKVVDQSARDYRNPQNGETVHKPAHKKVKFSQSKNMKETLNS